MAVQIRLMGDRDEVAAVMKALEAGEPVIVMSDGGFAKNHRDNPAGRKGRVFGMAQLPAEAELRVRQASAERMDREQCALPPVGGIDRRS